MIGLSLHMTWTDLVFLHWPVPSSVLRPLVPPELEIETFQNTAWIAVTPFQMRDVRVSAMPPVPTTTDFPELNVRTYVRHGTRSGVWFFSLDAGSWLAVAGARAATGLPYYHARMAINVGAESIEYESERTHPGAPLAEFRARYRPTGDVFRSLPGSFEYWCTERYSLFSLAADRSLLRLDVEHERWSLQPATVDIARNTMTNASQIDLPAVGPQAMFSKQLDVIARWPAPIQAPAGVE